MSFRRRFLILLISALVFSGAAARAEAPTVVVSIAPLHSLASAIMAGVGAPVLLLDRRTSPHDTTLRPSQARALARADLVLWVGPALERFMVNIVKPHASEGRLLTVLNLAHLQRLAVRAEGVWTAAHDHAKVGKRGDVTDPHVWLSVANARVIAGAVAERLSKIDPANAATYANNRAALLRELATLEAEIRDRLAPVHETPFVLLHDAFQYFERAYDLHPVGALTTRAAGGASAKRLHELRGVIAARAVRCIAADPFGASPLAKTLAQSGALALVPLDPLGLSLPPGPGLYPSMMRANAEALASCLRLR